MPRKCTLKFLSWGNKKCLFMDYSKIIYLNLYFCPMRLFQKVSRVLFFFSFSTVLLLGSCKNKNQTIREELNLGVKATYANEWQIAIDHFNYVLSLDSNNAEAYLYLGRTFMGKRKYKKALSLFDKSILKNPNLGEAYRSRAQVYVILGDRDASCHDYLKAEALGVENLHNYTKFCK